MEKERIISYALLGAGVVFFMMGLVKVIRGEESGEPEEVAIRRARILIIISLLFILGASSTMVYYKKSDMTKRDMLNFATIFLATLLTLVLALRSFSVFTLSLGTLISSLSAVQLILE